MHRIYFLLLIVFLTSCASVIEKIEMSNPKLSCVKKYKEGEYSVFGVKFNKESGIISFIPSKSRCFINASLFGFTGAFETPSIIAKTNENYKAGNSSFLYITIFSTKNLENKYKTNQELSKVITASIEKRIFELENNKNSRFSNIINNLGKLSRDANYICKNLFQSVRDSAASNLPRSEQYLVMNTFYKSCFIPDLEIFIDLGLSVRSNKENIKNFDSKYLENYIMDIEKIFFDKKL